MVTIQIPSGKKFQAPAQLLAHHSKYFRAALNSPMKEATALHFDLVEHAGDEALDLFCLWLYSRPLSLGTRRILHTRANTFRHCTDILIQAWRLGDYLQAIDFKNDILFALDTEVLRCAVDDHPFVKHSSQLEGLDTKSSLYRMLATMLGQVIFAQCSVDHIRKIFKAVDADARAAVTECIALYSAEQFDWMRQDANYESMSDKEKLRRLDESVNGVVGVVYGVKMEDFLEESE